MAHGADINTLPIPVIDIDSACTALQAALMSAVPGRLDLLSAMLDLGADHASYDASSPDFEWLLAHGADKTIKDNNGKRAFHLVAKSLTVVRQVLK